MMLETHRKIRELKEKGEYKVLDPIEKAHANPKSMRAAINGKCYECSGFQKMEVRDCHITDCCLWKLRPWQTYMKNYKNPNDPD